MLTYSPSEYLKNHMNSNKELAPLVFAGRASEDEMNRLGGDVVAELKSNPEIVQIRGRGSDIITKNESKRQISYVVSDETPDRMGDIIRVKGWNLKQYAKNPVILWAHDGSSVPPIGRASNVRRRYAPEARLTADVEFAPREAYEFADTIYQLANRGFIRATSVGFLPLETEEVDEKARQKLGLGRYGQLYTKTELMEVSVVAVPANPSALEVGAKELVHEGVIEKTMLAKFLQAYPKDEETALKNIRAVCRSFVDFGPAWQENAKRDEEATELRTMDNNDTIEKDPVERAYNEDDPVELAVPEALDADLEEKSPPCRQDGETEEECVSRKVPELIDMDGMDQDEAVAAAYSMCSEACAEKNLESQTAFVNAMSSMLEQQAEHTRATRQLVDALSDLTRQVNSNLRGGVQGDGSVTEPDVATPDAEQKEMVNLDGILEGRLRGFAEGLRRDLNLSDNNKNNR